MKRQTPAGLVVHPNLRRLLLLCTFALVLLAFAQPGLAQDPTEAKSAEPSQDSVVATTGSGLAAVLGTAELASPGSTASCLSIKCWITCDNGLSRDQYFTNTVECYSYADATGCHGSGLFVCSDKPATAGC